LLLGTELLFTDDKGAFMPSLTFLVYELSYTEKELMIGVKELFTSPTLNNALLSRKSL
jgi:hypothetical protein